MIRAFQKSTLSSCSSKCCWVSRLRKSALSWHWTKATRRPPIYLQIAQCDSLSVCLSVRIVIRFHICTTQRASKGRRSRSICEFMQKILISCNIFAKEVGLQSLKNHNLATLCLTRTYNTSFESSYLLYSLGHGSTFRLLNAISNNPLHYFKWQSYVKLCLYTSFVN